jgi:hypothetical protein
VYEVRPKRRLRRIGDWESQYSAATCSVREADTRSEMPRKVKRMAMTAVAGLGRANEVAWGWRRKGSVMMISMVSFYTLSDANSLVPRAGCMRSWNCACGFSYQVHGSSQ